MRAASKESNQATQQEFLTVGRCNQCGQGMGRKTPIGVYHGINAGFCGGAEIVPGTEEVVKKAARA